MAVQERLYTAKDLLALPHDKMRYALVEGHLVEMSPTGKTHGQLTSEINYLLMAFVRQHNLGRVYGAETGFKLAENPDTVFGIDIAFVSKARAQTGDDYFIGAPDLAVEVVSPSNTTVEMHDKVKQYFKKGSRLVWIVYPKSRTIYVYHSETDVQILGEADTLDGADVLPGFSIRIADIFAVLSEQI